MTDVDGVVDISGGSDWGGDEGSGAQILMNKIQGLFYLWVFFCIKMP